MPFHGFQLHLIGKRLFGWQYLFPLKVAVHHDDDGLIVCQLPDDTGHSRQARQLCRPLAPVAGHHLITAVRHGPDQGGDQDAVLLYTVCQFQHTLVHPHLERVVGKVADFFRREVGHIAALGVVPLLLGGEYAIYRGQKPGCALFAQSPTPPLSVCGRRLLPVPWVHAEKCSCPPC